MRAETRPPSGFTLIELIVAIAIVGILTGAAVSSFKTRAYEFRAAVSEVTADIRLARTFAQSRGAHYRIRILDDSSYAIERLRLDADGTWQLDDRDRRTKTLPPGARFDMSMIRDQGSEYEFDTRGTRLLNRIPDRMSGLVAMVEPRSGARESFQILPSGQVIPW